MAAQIVEPVERLHVLDVQPDGKQVRLVRNLDHPQVARGVVIRAGLKIGRSKKPSSPSAMRGSA